MTTTIAQACWADTLSATERQALARKLANASQRFYHASHRSGRRGGYGRQDGLAARRAASAAMSELHLDVTERAEVPTS